MFRRRADDASGVLEPDQQPPGSEDDAPASRPRPAFTAPKGVPTPKRSVAQANRRQPYQAPADRKTARTRNRAERIRQTEAYQRGEQWALPRKDQGPVRALARDVTDARRGIGEYYMILFIIAVVLLIGLPASLKYIGDALALLLLVSIVIEGWFVSRKVKRLAAERHPGHSTQGVTWYVISRGIAMRRLRMPKPRVNRGDKV